MTDEAKEYMKKLAGLWVKTGRRGHETWKFDGGKDTPVHVELSSLGFIKLQGAKGASYVFTDTGFQEVLAIVDAGEAIDA